MGLYHGPEGRDCWRECEQPCVVVHWQLWLRERCCSEVYTCVGMDPGHRICRCSMDAHSGVCYNMGGASSCRIGVHCQLDVLSPMLQKHVHAWQGLAGWRSHER